MRCTIEGDLISDRNPGVIVQVDILRQAQILSERVELLMVVKARTSLGKWAAWLSHLSSSIFASHDDKSSPHDEADMDVTNLMWPSRSI